MAHNMGYLQDLPIDRFSNFVWFMLTRDAEKVDREKLLAELWRPDRGQVVTNPRSPWSAENEGKGIAALKASMGG